MAHQAVRDAADAKLPEVHDVARQCAGLVAEDVRHLHACGADLCVFICLMFRCCSLTTYYMGSTQRTPAFVEHHNKPVGEPIIYQELMKETVTK